VSIHVLSRVSLSIFSLLFSAPSSRVVSETVQNNTVEYWCDEYCAIQPVRGVIDFRAALLSASHLVERSDPSILQATQLIFQICVCAF